MVMDNFKIQLLIQMKEADPHLWSVPSALYLQVQGSDLSRLYTEHQFLRLNNCDSLTKPCLLETTSTASAVGRQLQYIWLSKTQANIINTNSPFS